MRQPLTSRPPASAGIAVVLGIALATFAFGLCAVLENPRAQAPESAAAPEPELAAVAGEGAAPMRDPLARHLARSPRDGRGWVLLARIDLAGDRFAAAAEAYRMALEASPKVARDPGVWCEYADALAMAQGGVLAGRPRELIERALALDPRHERALEMAGSAAFEAGDFVAATRNWRRLLAMMPADTPAFRELDLAIRQAERRRDGRAGRRISRACGRARTRRRTMASSTSPNFQSRFGESSSAVSCSRNSIRTSASSNVSRSLSACGVVVIGRPLTRVGVAPSTWAMKKPCARRVTTATCVPGLPSVVSGLTSFEFPAARAPDR